MKLAKENGQEFTEEQAKAYFEQFCKTGELSDDELENAAGGGCGGEHKPTPVKNKICPKCKSDNIIYMGNYEGAIYECQNCFHNHYAWYFIDK